MAELNLHQLLYHQRMLRRGIENLENQLLVAEEELARLVRHRKGVHRPRMDALRVRIHEIHVHLAAQRARLNRVNSLLIN